VTPRAGRALAFAAGLGLVAGCTVGPSYKPPTPPQAEGFSTSAPPVETASAGGEAQRLTMGGAVASRWWTLFGSSRLDALEAEALDANADLASAKAALRQARELYLAQHAMESPTADLASSAARARNSATIAPPLSSNAEVYSLFTAQLNIAYVFDLFGALRRQSEAAAALAEAQRSLAAGVYLTLTTNVAMAAVQLGSLTSQLDDAQAIIVNARRAADIARRRERLGEAPAADVVAAEAALAQAEQAAPPLRKQIVQTQDLLATLVGRTPAAAPVGRLDLSAFRLPPEAPVSFPADLLRQRPDVSAAEANVHAAFALAGAAAAARWPSFVITAAPGGASSQVGTLFTQGNAFWSITGAASQTVFDAGALRHRQRAAEAAEDQARAQYRGIVLAALQNTADVLGAVVADAEAARQSEAAAAAADRSVSLARNEAAAGEIGSLAVLTAEAARLQARIGVTQARAARLADTITLYQALGGGWHADS
jgi:NodT family efflux transporter outer membrane factor (OMF) lipoprotein